jgi:hypothetical protein
MYGWGEKCLETGTCQSSEQSPKNALLGENFKEFARTEKGKA